MCTCTNILLGYIIVYLLYISLYQCCPRDSMLLVLLILLLVVFVAC